MIQARRNRIFPLSQRNILITVFSFLGGWVLCVPYEGQLLYTLAEYFHMDSYIWLMASLIMQIIGLLAGGLLIRTIQASKQVLITATPLCILCTGTLLIPSIWIWIVSLMVCSVSSGLCMASCGHFFRLCTPREKRFSAAANILVFIAAIKLVVNCLVVYVNAYVGDALLAVMLAVAWYFSFQFPQNPEEEPPRQNCSPRRFWLALMMLCLFISVSTIDFGIMTLTVGPTYSQPAWLTSWYWLLPYAIAALLMKRIKAWMERSSMLYIAFGMIGLSFILFLVLHRSISSYLIIFTLMMSAWAIFDVFWWSTLGEMLDMHNNAALVLGVGYSANAFGVFNGKLLGNVQLSITGTENTLIPLAVICVTLVILPLLNQSISKLLVSGKSDVYTRPGSAELALINGGSTVAFAVPQPAQEADAVFASGSPDVLTEREKQIVTLLLKGRTYKLIAGELYLSENTVKTHVKNIYAKLAVRTKSELFKKFDPS